MGITINMGTTSISDTVSEAKQKAAILKSSSLTKVLDETKKKLKKLNIDSTNIKTEVDAQKAIKKAETEEKEKNKSVDSSKTSDIEDTAEISDYAKKASTTK